MEIFYQSPLNTNGGVDKKSTGSDFTLVCKRVISVFGDDHVIHNFNLKQHSCLTYILCKQKVICARIYPAGWVIMGKYNAIGIKFNSW